MREVVHFQPAWAKALKLGMVASVSLTVGVATSLLRGLGVPSPNVQLGGVGLIPIQSIGALVAVAAMVYALRSLDTAAQASTERPCFAIICLVGLAAAALPIALSWVFLDSVFPYSISYVRSVIGFLALALLSWRLLGATLASVTPLFALLIMGLLGRNPISREPTWWAWGLVIQPWSGFWLLPVVILSVAGLWVSTIPMADLRRG